MTTTPAVFGPYDTYDQITDTPLAREVSGLHRANLVKSGDPDKIAHNTYVKHIRQALADSGVDLGTLDHRYVEWLAGWDVETVQVFIGLFTRAHAAGLAAATAEPATTTTDENGAEK